MSQEEQDMILGRLTRQSRDADIEESALHSKLRDFAESFKAGWMGINGTTSPPYVESPASIAEKMGDVPSGGQVLEVIGEWQAAKAKAKDLRERLAAMVR